MIWANFLHLYQSPKQNPALLKIIVKESYQLIINLLKKNRQAKFTLNISGSLTELLIKYKREKIISQFKELLTNGQIELTASAKYHPILPLIPEKEIIRSIELNEKINKAHFGSAYNPTGFYCPEMAYNKKVGEVIKKMGYKWIILDEISYGGKLEQVDFKKRYEIKDLGLKVIFRNRLLSKTFVPDVIKDKLKDNKSNEIVITATDGELYGHHHKDYQKIFNKILSDKNLKTINISNLIKAKNNAEIFEPIESSWETSEEDLKNNIPFPLWDDPKNEIHQLLWQLANLTIEINEKYNPDNRQIWSRKHLDRGLASCSWWWASAKKPSAFSPLTWNPDKIVEGAEELIKSVRSNENITTEIKIKAEKIYSNLQEVVWHKHWNYYEKNNK